MRVLVIIKDCLSVKSIFLMLFNAFYGFFLHSSFLKLIINFLTTCLHYNLVLYRLNYFFKKHKIPFSLILKIIKLIQFIINYLHYIWVRNGFQHGICLFLNIVFRSIKPEYIVIDWLDGHDIDQEIYTLSKKL